MRLLDRLRRRSRAIGPALSARRSRTSPIGAAEEAPLRETLHRDPNDAQAFARLAEIVRRRAEEGHEGEDRPRAANDAVWALAEELGAMPRAWYPLIELARLSVNDDQDGALRRLGIAAEREHTGRGLAAGLAMLRRAGMPDAALSLGVGHWRPAEHEPEAGRELVQAAVEAGRMSEARRHLDALGAHPDKGRVAPLQAELEKMIERRRPRARR